jgi:hypothetical protein
MAINVKTSNGDELNDPDGTRLRRFSGFLIARIDRAKLEL